MDLIIEFPVCRRTCCDLEKQIRVLTISKDELDNIIQELKTIDDTAIQMIVVKLMKNQQKFEENIQRLRFMAAALEQIIYQYERTERKVEELSMNYIIRAETGWKWPKKDTFFNITNLPGIDAIAKYFG